MLCYSVFMLCILRVIGVRMLCSLPPFLHSYFLIAHRCVFSLQHSCQPRFHVRDTKVLTYFLDPLQLFVF